MRSALDLSSAPAPRASIRQQPVGDEIVLYVEESGHTYHLGSGAATVWRCLGPDVPLTTIAEDIAAVSGWALHHVREDLLTVVRDFERQGLLDTPAARVPRPRAHGRSTPTEGVDRVIPVTDADCAQRPDVCWFDTRTVRVGRYLVGVRCDSARLDAALASLVEGRTLDGEAAAGAVAPPNYSLRLAVPGGTGHHLLLRACETTVRTRSVTRLLTALGGYLTGHHAEHDTDLVHLDAMVLVRRGAAWLLPANLRASCTDEDTLTAYGFAIADTPTAAVDPDTLEVVVPEPVFAPDRITDATRSVGGSSDALSPAAAPGRYPLTDQVSLNVQPGHREGGPSAAEFVAAANRRVWNRDAIGVDVVLPTLTRVAADTEHHVLDADDDTATMVARLSR